MSTPCAAPFPFFVGCGRSGTTLVRAMFDSHPDMAVVYESFFVSRLLRSRARYEGPEGFAADRFAADLAAHFAFETLGMSEPEVADALAPPPADTAGAIRRVYGRYAEGQGKERYADKTPMYVQVIPTLAAGLPEARFVHIIRDGRDVALGYMHAPWGPMRLADASLYWKRNVDRGRTAGARLGPQRYREVRYEQLIDEPEPVLRELCDFLELAFDPAMLRYYERSNEVLSTINNPQYHRGLSMPITKGMRDWRAQMGEGDVAVFEALAGDTLAAAGYERRHDPPAGRVRVAAAMGRGRVEAARLGHRVVKDSRRFRRRLTGEPEARLRKGAAGGDPGSGRPS